MSVRVNTDNFVRAETARMFDGIIGMAGGVNRFLHLRAPTPLDRQTVIRMNRDTLYSGAVVDVSSGASLHLPDAGDRYLSVMTPNEDHHINRVLREPGDHTLSEDELGTPWVHLSVRILVDPADPDDVAAVNALQDQIILTTDSTRSYTHPDYDPATLDETRSHLLALSNGLPDSRHSFGSMDETDPIRHLLGTAVGWGGLPESEAFYYLESEPRSSGHYTMTFRDVPVDAFWSVSVYNRDGFFEANPYDSYSVNSVTAIPEDDGSVVLDLAPEPTGRSNYLHVMDGWNYALRLYRPRPEVISGDWTAPKEQLLETT